jgi:hypothetical protein
VLLSLARYFAYLWMPWITYLSVIVRLFRVDPSKGKMPRDPLAVEKATPGDLLNQAKNRIKERVPITKSSCDLILLNLEALVRKIFTCRTSKFGMILNQGRSQIRRELNLFRFLKK